MSKLYDNLIRFYETHRSRFAQSFPEFASLSRETAFRAFEQDGFPGTQMEAWKGSKISRYTGKYYHLSFSDISATSYGNRLYECDIPGLEAEKVAVFNGYFHASQGKLFTLEEGIIVGSLQAAFQRYPDIVKTYFDHIRKKNQITNLNTAFFKDGLFVYVPENVQSDRIVQLSHGISGRVDSMFNVRNLIILGKNSRINLIQCDDTNTDMQHFSTVVSEYWIDEGAQLNYYNYQNINNGTVLLQNTFFHLEEKAQLQSISFNLNGAMIRNEHHVLLNGEYCEAQVQGLYLMDRDQHIDNRIYVDHAKPNGISRESFKGILDDHATGIFHGHILVRTDAQKTQAFQNNANILLTEKAQINTHPFLEIYADDVSCSHGATIGQLDEEAFFYMRTRGIGVKDARLLQLYAFTAEIINKIPLPQLRERTEDLVKKRLRGELDICDQCVLHCKYPNL